MLGACSPDKPSFHGTDITGVDYAKDFALTDFNDQPRTLADFKGKAVVVFFGYTQCPDVCPTTMGELVQVKQALGAEGDKLQVLLYTFILTAACLLPFIYCMSGWVYLAAALVLNAGFMWHAFRLWRHYSDALARKTFRFSLIHLSLLFAALLVDHYLL